MPKVMKSAVGLQQRIKAAVDGAKPMQVKVVEVKGNKVRVSIPGEVAPGETWYNSTQVSVAVGTTGVLVPMRGNLYYFQPMNQSHPLGKQHYDKGNGVQVGDINPANIVAGIDFIAIGIGAKILGERGISVGKNTESGQDALAMVGNAKSTGTGGTIAVGYSAEATGSAGVAMGTSAKATGDYAVAYGSSAIASGPIAIAVGRGATSTTDRSIAVGYNTSVTGGTAGIAMGSGTSVSAIGGIALGSAASATAGYAIAMGFSAIAGYSGDQYGEIAIGRSARSQFARGVAIGYGATVTRHYEGVITSDTLVIKPSSTRVHSKLGLVASNGTIYYLGVSTTGAVTATTTW